MAGNVTLKCLAIVLRVIHSVALLFLSVIREHIERLARFSCISVLYVLELCSVVESYIRCHRNGKFPLFISKSVSIVRSEMYYISIVRDLWLGPRELYYISLELSGLVHAIFQEVVNVLRSYFVTWLT